MSSVLPPITVQTDNRIRLLSALLALTTWPEQEQALKPHGVHAHARTTRTSLSAGENHTAVLTLQNLIESRLTLDAIFSYATYLSWPDLTVVDPPDHIPQEWPVLMHDFFETYRVAEVWERDAAVWESAAEAAHNALVGADPRWMLTRLFGSLDVEFVFQPNLCYPTADTLCFRDDKRLIAISPPPVAWGTNPPWPYDDNPADTAREVFSAYARLLLAEHLDAHPAETEDARKTRLPVPNTFLVRHPDWLDQFSVLFVSGATALYLRETFGKAEADAYMMMIHKANGFQALPTVVEVLESYFDAQTRGKAEVIADYLPTFTSRFRLAEKMKTV